MKCLPGFRLVWLWDDYTGICTDERLLQLCCELHMHYINTIILATALVYIHLHGQHFFVSITTCRCLHYLCCVGG